MSSSSFATLIPLEMNVIILSEGRVYSNLFPVTSIFSMGSTVSSTVDNNGVKVPEFIPSITNSTGLAELSLFSATITTSPVSGFL